MESFVCDSFRNWCVVNYSTGPTGASGNVFCSTGVEFFYSTGTHGKSNIPLADGLSVVIVFHSAGHSGSSLARVILQVSSLTVTLTLTQWCHLWKKRHYHRRRWGRWNNIDYTAETMIKTGVIVLQNMFSMGLGHNMPRPCKLTF